MVTCCSAPVSLSRAETCRMPLASMSKVTSIWGTPRGAGRIFSSRNRASTRLSAALSRSPWRTTTSTADWLSSAVLKISVRRAGMVVLRSMTLVITPPMRLEPQRQGRDVEEQHVLDVALDDRRLDGRADARRPRPG